MKNELEFIEELSLDTGKNYSRDSELSYQWIAEKDRFLRALMKSVLHFSNQKQIRYYIRWYQYKIIHLADQVFFFVQGHSSQDPARLKLIFDLLEEFKMAFENDFDISSSIPVGMHTNERAILTPVAGMIDAQLEAAGIRDDLREIVLMPFRELIESQAKPISFHRLDYLTHYINRLSLLGPEIGSVKDKESALVEILIDLNYNNFRLFRYVAAMVERRMVTDRLGQSDRLTYLNGYKMKINQISGSKIIYYTDTFPSIKKQLLKWLNEEIKLLKLRNSQPDEKSPSLKVNLSVSQMAYLTSLFFKHNLFLEPVKANVIRGITQTFSSRETTRISPGSFKSKAQEPGDNAVQEIRKLLKAMIKDTEEYLF